MEQIVIFMYFIWRLKELKSILPEYFPGIRINNVTYESVRQDPVGGRFKRP